jgi:hypothetical protein
LADVTTDWREKPKTWTERAIGLRSRVREPEKKNPKTISALEVAGKIGTVPYTQFFWFSARLNS